MSKEEIKAQEIWDSMNASEKAGARCGLFPVHVMKEAEVNELDGRKVCVALMECAKLALAKRD